MIVENVFGSFDKIEEDGSIHDDYRIDYFRGHIEAMSEAIEDGVPIQHGDQLIESQPKQDNMQNAMSLHDDGTGDFSRSRKDSFYWYKKVIESHGEDLDERDGLTFL